MDLLKLSRKDMESVRGNHISMIFQNPYTSLHPYFKIGRQTTEFLSHRLMMGKNEAEEKSPGTVILEGFSSFRPLIEIIFNLFFFLIFISLLKFFNII